MVISLFVRCSDEDPIVVTETDDDTTIEDPDFDPTDWTDGNP